MSLRLKHLVRRRAHLTESLQIKCCDYTTHPISQPPPTGGHKSPTIDF